MSYSRDHQDPSYQEFLATSHLQSVRADRLATVRGIPPEGPAQLLEKDPLTRGPELFARYCATCHPHLDEQGKGIAALKLAAPNLYGFASREWIAGLLDPEKIAGPHYFGPTPFAKDDFDEMIGYVRDTLYDVPAEETKARQAAVRKVAIALSAEAELPLQHEQDRADSRTIAEGRALLTGELGCTDCHRFGDAGELGSSPDLTRYGSREWLAAFVSNPGHPRFYAEENAGMPAFAPGMEGAQENLLPKEKILPHCRLAAVGLASLRRQPRVPMLRRRSASGTAELQWRRQHVGLRDLRLAVSFDFKWILVIGIAST